MGNVGHRIEVLLVGFAIVVVTLIAGGLYVVRTYVVPLDPARTVMLVTAAPAVAGGVPTSAPTVAPTSAPTVAPTSAPTVAPGVVQPEAIASARDTAFVSIALPVTVPFWLPGVLLIGGSLGMIAIYGRRIVRRRMPLTNQSVSQLLTIADPGTRATNLRVMQDLHQQGVLTPELQALLPGVPHPRQRTLPTLALPKLTLPVLRVPSFTMPKLALPRRAPVPVAALLTSAPLALPLAPAPDVTAAAGAWTSHDRMLAVMSALSTVWDAHAMRSTIRDLATSPADGRSAVLISIDAVPGEDALLLALPQRLTEHYPGWQVYWRTDSLEVTVDIETPSPRSVVPVVPVITVGRKPGMVHALPLHTWPHLAIYGHAAFGAAHAVINQLVLTVSPEHLALTILDHHELSTLYREIPHYVNAPDDLAGTLDALLQAVKYGNQHDARIRPVLVVVVNPHPDVLDLLTDLWNRLRVARTPRMYLLLVATTPPVAPELVATMPALVTGGSSGSVSGIPGGDGWPKAGQARLIGRIFRRDGVPFVLDEASVAANMDTVRGHPHGTRDRVLWHAEPDHLAGPVLPQPVPVPQPVAPVVEQGDDPRPDSVAAPAVLLADGPAASVAPIAVTPVAVVALVDVARAAPVATPTESVVAELPHVDTSPDASDRAQVPPVDINVSTDHAMFTEAALPHPDASDRAQVPPVDMPTPTTDQSPVSDPLAEMMKRRLQRSLPPPPPAPVQAAPVQAAPVQAAPVQTAPVSPWPIGPDGLSALALSDLWTRLLVEDEIQQPHTSQQAGVSRKRILRLRALPGVASPAATAEQLLVWFAAAGLIASRTASDPSEVQAILVTDLDEIAARLRTCALPVREDA